MLKRGGLMKEINKDNRTENLTEIPANLSSALAHNIPAMRVFAELSDEKRRGIIEGARNLTSKKEMRSYVKDIKNER